MEGEKKPECPKPPCGPFPPFCGPCGPCGPCPFEKAEMGAPAPEFKTKCWDNGLMRDITLSEFKGKWVVLFFYPRDFTFVCPTEICAFSDASDNFGKINTAVIGCSTDSEYVHREWALKERKMGGLNPCKIPLMADSTHEISKKYGCYICKGADKGATYRATYIIDPEGILRHISMNDLGVGRSTDEVMRLVQAFQFNAEHGDVCPSNWKPGRKTMKPQIGDPTLKKYFEDEMAKGK